MTKVGEIILFIPKLSPSPLTKTVLPTPSSPSMIKINGLRNLRFARFLASLEMTCDFILIFLFINLLYFITR